MRALLLGTLTLSVTGLISLIAGDWAIVFNYSGLIGLVSLIISALLSGTFISGDRIRSNWTYENNDDKNTRQKYATKLFLFGLPNIIGALIYVSLTR